MTDYRNILVPVTDGMCAQSSLDAAFRLAALSGGHVVGLHVRTDPASAVPLVGEGMSGAMVEEMMNLADRQAGGRAGEAKAAFDTAAAKANAIYSDTPISDSGVTAQWVEVVGREEEVVSWRGRLSDIIIMGRPIDGEETPSTLTLNAALMESGKPLAITPCGAPLTTIGTRVAVAWNGSAEAARAVAAAIPMMKAAEAVYILTVAEDDRTESATDSDLASHLAWHGITAKTHLIQGGNNAGQILLSECEKLGIDLLVMGAYTHSRLRQLILGGVTRHVMNKADIACLLCH